MFDRQYVNPPKRSLSGIGAHGGDANPAELAARPDIDPASIETARASVAASGLSGRVRPILQDASDTELGGRYDLVTIFEALHDMNHAVEALRAARHMLAEEGSVVVADERVAERFTAPGDELERFNYGWSVVHCLAVGMLDEDWSERTALRRWWSSLQKVRPR